MGTHPLHGELSGSATSYTASHKLLVDLTVWLEVSRFEYGNWEINSPILLWALPAPSSVSSLQWWLSAKGGCVPQKLCWCLSPQVDVALVSIGWSVGCWNPTGYKTAPPWSIAVYIMSAVPRLREQWAGLEKNAMCFSSHEARPLNNLVGAMPLEMFCLKILS